MTPSAGTSVDDVRGAAASEPSDPALAWLTGEVVLVSVFSLLLLAGSAGYWTYLDAVKREDERALLWGLGVFVGTVSGVVPGVAVLLVYRFRGRPGR
jgi:uncharacterized membrane-anchored protein